MPIEPYLDIAIYRGELPTLHGQIEQSELSRLENDWVKEKKRGSYSVVIDNTPSRVSLILDTVTGIVATEQEKAKADE